MFADHGAILAFHQSVIRRPVYRIDFRAAITFSVYSLPCAAANATYRIHLVKSEDPAYIPSDLEAWPIYYQAIHDVLRLHPAAHDAAIEAIRATRKELAGLENRDDPPG